MTESDSIGILASVTKLLFNTLILGLILLLIVLLLLYFYQNKLLYMPVIPGQPKSPSQNPPGYKNPSDVGLSFENITIKTLDQITLRGWICKQQNSKEVPTIIYLHENAGNIGTRVQYLQHYYHRLKVNLILIAYRGYSDSEGEPSEQGLVLDAEQILNHTLHRDDIDQKQIYLHGRSLGGAVTAYLATTNMANRLSGIIMENTFTSISDMVDQIFPKLKWFKSFLLRNHWKSIDRVQQIKLPILFIMSMQDEIVPPQQMVTLFTKAKQSPLIRKKIVIEEGNHNGNWAQDPQKYFTGIKDFIELVGNRDSIVENKQIDQ